MTAGPSKDASSKIGCGNVVKTNICPPDTTKSSVKFPACKMKDDTSKKMGQLKSGGTNLVKQVVATLTKSSAPKQLALGSVAGWTTGVLTMKVGRTAAFAIGGSIILFQVAQHTGYVKMDWDKVKEKVDNTSKQINSKLRYAEKSPKWKANITKFARGNTYFAAGFVGGFLIGIAS